MAQPLPKNTETFSSDQRIAYRGYYWDTTSTAAKISPMYTTDRYTAFGAGIEYAMFDLLTTKYAPASQADIEATLAPSSRLTSAVLGYDVSGKYRTGVVQHIHQYWGSGSPTGGSRSKATVLKFSGYVREAASNVTLVFAGQGTVRVFRTPAGGSSSLIASGTLKEPSADVDLTHVTSKTITDEWGYVYSQPLTLNVGDKIDIYYWHNGEPWGGIAARVYPGAIDTSSDSFLSQLRSAPPLSTSFMSRESAPLPATEIRYITKAQVRKNENAITEMQVEVALTRRGEATGYWLDTFRDENNIRDNADISHAIKKGRLVHLVGGYIAPNGTEEVYARFTGYIDDIFPNSDATSVLITCKSIEAKLSEPYDENAPDRLTYHANGFIMRERANEPVFGIPAFDGWPLEVMAADLCIRAGIDPYNLGMSGTSANPQFGRWRFMDATTEAPFYGTRKFAARQLAHPDRQIQIERHANYGNVGPLAKDALPRDDAYMFPPTVSQRLYDRMKSITDHYGYDFITDAEGQITLAARNNPIYFQYLTRPGTYATTLTPKQDEGVGVAAVGGIYFKKQHSAGAWTRVIEGHFSRLDLYAGVGIDVDKVTGNAIPNTNGGKVNVLIESWNGSAYVTVQSKTISTYAGSKTSFYYNDLTNGDGSNAALIKILQLPLDRYRVTLTPGGPQNGDSDCVYRLNGVAVFERDPDQSYYNKGLETRKLSTLGNTLRITPESNVKDLRNQIITVGARKATLTDSSKLNNETTNPNNPEYEFHIAVSVDPFSIYDPTSANFVGMKKMTVIFDEKVNDSEFARWLARTLLFRYRMPKTSAKLTHTAIPVLELRDAMLVVEERNKSVEHMLWVKSFTETWTPKSATVDIDAVANPEIPSFQPREDIDIDDLFVDPADGLGEPIINMDINYLNLLGRPVSAVHLEDQVKIKSLCAKASGTSAPRKSEAILSASNMRLSAAAIPETMYLSWNIGASSALAGGRFALGYLIGDKRALVNNPYRHFFYISDWDSSHRPNVVFTFEEADGTAGVYDKNAYNFPNLNGGQWFVNYDELQPRVDSAGHTTENPYYDPYTSEVGNLVSITFDALVSGRYRISLWNRGDEGGLETPVAWLSNPAGDPEEPEQHWVYMSSGEAQSFAWDGVDNIGFWNILQSADWADALNGAFGEVPNAVGRGYYAWNDISTNPHTQVGDATTIGGVTVGFDKNNKPYFTIGQFGQFFVRVEVLNDDLVRKDLRSIGRADPRTVNSHTLPNKGTWNTVSQLYVWTHLPEPSQIAIRIQDWAGSGSWTTSRVTTDADWGNYSTPATADAAISVGKPIRVTFVPQARRGPQFEDANRTPDPTLTGAKLTRNVHHKGTFMDQFWTMKGSSWAGFNAKYEVGGTENRRVTSRMFHNEDHTLAFEDTSYRTGSAIQNFEWIFDPSLFVKDFGTGQKEKLRYADYSQLESLPGFDAKKLGGTASGTRAYLTLAFISHLFYFSAFSLDRSGRRQWCLNSWTDDQGKKRGFIDRTKIVSPNWRGASNNPASGQYRPYAIVGYEEKGADTYLARSVFVRQWKEAWSTTYPGNPKVKYNITDAHQLKFVQFPMKNLDPESGYFVDNVNAKTDLWLQEYSRLGSVVNKRITYGAEHNHDGLTLDGITNYKQMPSGFGTWNFDRTGVTGWFNPSPVRDFHPFWRYPYMPDWATIWTWWMTKAQSANAVSVLAGTSSQIVYHLRDLARQQIWYGYAFSEKYANEFFNANPSKSDSDRYQYYGARLEQTVEELGGTDPKKVPYTITSPEIAAMFDYARQDDLDRYDMFRGVISRAPYPDPNAGEDAQWDTSDKKRASAPQPVKPSGVYFTNLARYADYSVAPIHPDLPNTYGHFTTNVTDWFDLRFHHEYVWYSDRYFPVTPSGGAVYMYTKDEYTKVSGWVGAPWWAVTTTDSAAPRTAHRTDTVTTFDTKDIRFDSGAWIGWKCDLTASQWTGDPHLRWREVGGISPSLVNNLTMNLSGGFGFFFNGHGTSRYATSETMWWTASLTKLSPVVRMGIFDEYGSRIQQPRLAVGPEPAESVGVVMNLSLPAKLIG